MWAGPHIVTHVGGLRAHGALKQTLDFETAPGTAGATTQGGEHCFPRREPGWKRPHATCKAVAFSPLFSREPVGHGFLCGPSPDGQGTRWRVSVPVPSPFSCRAASPRVVR